MTQDQPHDGDGRATDLRSQTLVARVIEAMDRTWWDLDDANRDAAASELIGESYFWVVADHAPTSENPGYCGGCDHCGATEERVICKACGLEWPCLYARPTQTREATR
ncbi:hypothetical protein [Enterococcus hirae]|uniref:hypothetical protein n=1 Tax=Enterococcus hirae TaxID=1354 RepID=UPI0013AD8443|nr:hypothetical protein [Enterococcus hirae]NAE18011.1 hypothetical protein [Enterococcus hirae]